MCGLLILFLHVGPVKCLPQLGEDDLRQDIDFQRASTTGHDEVSFKSGKGSLATESF